MRHPRLRLQHLPAQATPLAPLAAGMNGLHIPWALIAWILILLVPIAVSLFVQAARTPKRPAGVEPHPPERLPLPGPGPAHPHDGLPPDAGAPVPPVVRRFDVLDCGSTTSYRCVTIYDTRDRSTVHVQCPEHRIGFNIAEWNERLRQS